MVESGGWSPLLWLRRWVAIFANRFCDQTELYWAAPDEWEEYMSQGEPRPTWTPVPQDIFKDIETLADSSYPYNNTALRVVKWLYSDQVTIKDGQP